MLDRYDKIALPLVLVLTGAAAAVPGQINLDTMEETCKAVATGADLTKTNVNSVFGIDLSPRFGNASFDGIDAYTEGCASNFDVKVTPKMAFDSIAKTIESGGTVPDALVQEVVKILRQQSSEVVTK